MINIDSSLVLIHTTTAPSSMVFGYNLVSTLVVFHTKIAKTFSSSMVDGHKIIQVIWLPNWGKNCIFHLNQHAVQGYKPGYEQYLAQD